MNFGRKIVDNQIISEKEYYTSKNIFQRDFLKSFKHEWYNKMSYSYSYYAVTGFMFLKICFWTGLIFKRHYFPVEARGLFKQYEIEYPSIKAEYAAKSMAELAPDLYVDFRGNLLEQKDLANKEES